MRKLMTALLFCGVTASAVDAIAQKNAPQPFGTSTGELPYIVYKMKKDYRNLVPVTLSNDKKSIVSYPDPKDVKLGKNLKPVALHKGFYLDKRGITNNVAFIKMTYEQYAKLKSAPELPELYKMIVDKDPLKEFCLVGKRKEFPANPVKKLNELIDKKKLVCN